MQGAIDVELNDRLKRGEEFENAKYSDSHCCGLMTRFFQTA